MRLLWVIVPLVILAAGCGQDTGGSKPMSDTASLTTIKWLDSIVSFDTAKAGDQVKVTFRFRNTGNKPLYLSEVKAGCGCTVPDYTKGAIAPGAGGEVTGLFNTMLAHGGSARKTIFVLANTKDNARHTLIFTGFIKDE